MGLFPCLCSSSGGGAAIEKEEVEVEKKSEAAPQLNDTSHSERKSRVSYRAEVSSPFQNLCGEIYEIFSALSLKIWIGNGRKRAGRGPLF